MKTLKLRPYQEEVLVALEKAWDEGLKRPAVVLPTGMGKTVIFAALVDKFLQREKRSLVLVHREELVHQTVDKLHSTSPDLVVGVVKAERNEIDADVVVASVQTLSRISRLEQISQRNFDLVVVDECHHAASPSYRRILDWFGCLDALRPAKAVGFTATMKRNDKKGLGDVWEEVVYTKQIQWGIHNGYLVPIEGRTVSIEGLDLDSIKTSHGDYSDQSLAEALELSMTGPTLADNYLKLAQNERGIRPGVLFSPTVETCYSFKEHFDAFGIPTEVIVGDTPTADRQRIYQQMRDGKTKVLSSCMVLTEGFDMPEVEVAVIARPTKLKSLYVQMVGRVLRPAVWSGKEKALVLDVVGVTRKHDLTTLVDLKESRSESEGPELCLNCRCVCSLCKCGCVCDACSYEPTEREKRDKDIAYGAEFTEVDLFNASANVWLVTKGGVWFIPTTRWTFFLLPKGDLWRVGKKPTFKAPAGSKTELIVDDVEFSYAMAWAEQAATDEDPTIAEKGRSWRTGAPSDAQVSFAKGMGIDTTSLRRGELSDRISVAVASRSLDKYV